VGWAMVGAEELRIGWRGWGRNYGHGEIIVI
jgi:hypothetical protein